MDKKVLERLDQMITRNELRLAATGVQRGAAPDELNAKITRLETGLYALREGVHGFLKAKECGVPLESFDRYLQSLEGVAMQAEKLLLDAIIKLEEFSDKGRRA